MEEKLNISVLMSIYQNSVPNEVKECLESLYLQTYPSNDIVIVKDGPVSAELSELLQKEQAEHPEIQICSIEENVGLGNALRYGMQFCKNELVARMDTDDICMPERFKKQIACFFKDSSLSIVGSDIAEFIGTPENVVTYRKLPFGHDEICKYMKKRCPFNHMTVMFRKTEVERAGGYLDWHYNEDSYLWVRMLLAGCRFANIPETLVYARINSDTFMRRGGYNYYKSERDLFKFMKKNKIIGSFVYIKAKFVRFIVYVCMPNRIRQWAFRKFAREE